VRAEKSDAEEKRLLLVLAHEFDRFGGDHAIGLLFVGAIGCEPAQGCADFAVWFQVGDKVFLFGVASFGVDDLIPGLGIVEAIGSNLMGNAVVVEFSHAHGFVSVVSKQLR
jgi:hypothetical protein